ncbi:unnamed protein product, partial [Laminaria digitata]
VDLVLRGASNVNAVIDGGNSPGLFLVSNGSTLTLNDLVLEGGDAGIGGAISVADSSSLRVSNSYFTNNRASKAGGETMI